MAVAILTFLRVGALHGDTFRLYALVGEARTTAVAHLRADLVVQILK